MLKGCGFTDIRVNHEEGSKSFLGDWAPGADITAYVLPATIEAVKPMN
jgi:arsenite methyltransferase